LHRHPLRSFDRDRAKLRGLDGSRELGPRLLVFRPVAIEIEQLTAELDRDEPIAVLGA
jgi:hypothetical protein